MKQWIWICWLLVSPLCLAQEMSEKNWQDIFDASCEMLKVEADREKGEQALALMEDHDEAPYHLRVNAAIALSNHYLNHKRYHDAHRHIKQVRRYRDENPDNSEMSNAFHNLRRRYIHEGYLEKEPVTGRFMGQWVSADTDPATGFPLLMITVHTEYDHVVCDVHPDCWFYQHCPAILVAGNPNLEIQDHSLWPYAIFYFGNKAVKKGPVALAKSLAETSARMGQETNRAIAVQHRDKPLSTGNIAGQTATNVMTGLAQGFAAELSVSRSYHHAVEIRFDEKSLGEVEARITYYHLMMRSDGGSKDGKHQRTLRMFKTDKNVVFYLPNGAMTGGANFMTDEQKELFERDRSDVKGINQLAYKSLLRLVETRKDIMLEDMDNVQPMLEASMRSLCYTPGTHYYSKKIKERSYTGFRGMYRSKPLVMASLTKWMDAYSYTDDYGGSYDSGTAMEASKLYDPVEGELLDFSNPIAYGVWEKGKFTRTK